MFKCPIDKRQFKTQAALKQHTLTKHGGGRAPAVPRPVPLPRKTVPGGLSVGPQPSRRVAGTDMLGLVTVTAPGAVGLPLLEAPLNPGNFASTRFQAEAALWNRWRPLRLNLRIVPSAGTFINGMYTAGWNANPVERLGSADGAVRQLSTYRPNATSHVSKQLVLSIPCEASQRWYVLGKEVADSTHGVVHAVMSSQLTGVTTGSQVSLYVHLDWEVEFSGPDLPSVSSGSHIYARSGYEGYHTTSVSDWAAGKCLTLKERAGGNAVPFDDAEPGVVYKLDPAAKLQYLKDAAGNKSNIKYGVRIPNYYSPAIAVFEEEAKAKAFASTGDSANCLTYHGAGPAVSPDNPAWAAQSVSALLSFGRKEQPAAQSIRADGLLEAVLRRLEALEVRSRSGSFVDLGEEEEEPVKAPLRTAWSVQLPGGDISTDTISGKKSRAFGIRQSHDPGTSDAAGLWNCGLVGESVNAGLVDLRTGEVDKTFVQEDRD